MDDLLVRFVSWVASCFLKLRFLAPLTRQLLTAISPISNYPNVFAESRSTNKKLLQLNAVYLVAALALLFAGGASAVDIRVNAGGTQYTDSLGNVWSADTGYNTGNTASRPVAIANTTDDVLHHAQRWDPGAAPDLTYSFSIPNGDYAVTLHFAETYSGTSGVGLRVFDVQMEGALVMGKVDIFSEAGGPNIALSRTVSAVKVSDGYLDIKFLQQVENPTISAIEIHSVVSTSSVNRPESAYYILNPKFETGPLQVASLSDGNTITVGNTILNLDQYQMGTVPAGVDLASGTLIQGAGPFSLGGEVNATDLPVPARFIGSQFVIPHNRGNHTYYILSPYGDAQVTATVGGVSTTVTALKGEVLTYDAGTVNGTSGLVQSDMPILISHTANAGAWDAYPVPPASKDLWGVRSNTADVGALEDNTSVTVYGSSGGTESFILNAGGFRALTIPSGSEGSGSAVHVVADKPIAAIQIADSDGIEATAFLSSAYLATNYVIPVNAQYIAVVCPDAGTMISLFSGSTQPVDMLCEGDGTTPGKTYFGSTTDGINIPAGAHLESTRPVYMYYESSATNDEHNILGHKEAYYVLNSRTQNAAVSVMSLVDNNRITAGSSEIFLNKYERGVIPAGSDLAPGAEIMGLGPFTLGADYNGTDMPVPAVFAANQFIIPHHRYAQTYAMLSPYGDADVDISLGSALPTTINLPQGQLVEFGAGSDTTISGLLQADRPILVVHKGNTSADVFPVAPAAMELWGLRSNTVALGALQDNTTATIFTSDGQSAVYNLDKGAKRTVSVGSTGDQGQGAAIHIVADKPVAAYQNADGDGSESTVFLSKQYLGTLYGIPVDAQYIAVVCPDANTTITLTDASTSQQQNCSGSATYPGKVYFGSSTNGVQINAGATLSATNPVYVIYEASVTNDEHNLLGYTINVQAPLASAGGPYSGVAGSAITFDGSGSTDPDGDLLTYSWDFGDSSPLGTGVTPTHTYSGVGTFTITLTVSDGTVASSPSNATVTVASANQPPVANAGGSYSGLVDGVISFNGSGSSDADGDPLSYSWDFGDGSTPGTGVSPDHIYTATGTYSATLTAYDGTTNSTPSTATVTINAVASPTLVNGTGGVQRVQQNSYSVQGTAQPAQSVNLYANGVLVNTLTADSLGRFQTIVTLQSGLNTLYAKAVSGGVESELSNLQSIFYESAAQGSQVVGAISGSFVVSENGSATYSIPVQSPPAISGVQPNLSLEYNSQSGNGLLGVGWSLGGISAIKRCPATLVQDGFIDGVDFDSNDRYCLDGQRLVPVTNTGCSGGTEYKTEIESYSRICAYGAQGTGPAYFTVQTKAGQLMEYGNSSNSRIEAQGRTDVLVWSANKVKDTLGNYYSLTYTENNALGQFYIQRIDYNATNGAGSDSSYIEFSYEARPDLIDGYFSGSKLSTTVRLFQIETFLGGQRVRSYQLAYAPAGPTDRSRLSQVTECGSDGLCKPPTIFGWQTGTARLVNKGAWISGAYASWASVPDRTRVMDVNGDGLSDMVIGPDANGNWYVLRNTGTSFINDGAWLTGAYGSWDKASGRVRPMDVNGDGLPDIVLGPDANGSWYVLRNTGSSFVNAGAWITGAYAAWEQAADRIRAMDVNGDGLSDIVIGPDASGNWYVLRNTGTSFINDGVWLTGAYGNWDRAASRTRVMDVNGDGLPDIVLGPDANGSWYVLRNTGSSFVNAGAWITGAYGAWDQVADRIRAMDVNGDGLSDIMLGPDASGNWYVLRNTGTSFINDGVWLTGAYGNWDKGADRIRVMDVNADDLADILIGPDANGSWYVLRNTGVSLVNEGAWLTGAYGNWDGAGSRVGVLDANGDGLSDVVLGPDAAGNWFVLQPDAGQRALVETITDAFGAGIVINYQPITNKAIYQRDNNAVFPETDVQLPIYVVSRSEASDGIGGTRATSYSYEGLKAHLQGRGFLGFRKVVATDNETNIAASTTFNQTFPLTGRVASSDTRLVGVAAPLSTSSSTWNTAPLDGGSRYDVQAAVTTGRSYELDGSLVTTVTTSNDLYDNYGNVKQISVTTVGGGQTFTEVTVSDYAQEDPANWILGRVTRTTVTSTTPTGSASRTSAFEYRTDGLLSAEIVEPLDPAFMLRTDYGYNSFGNRTSVTVSDSGGVAYPIETSPGNMSTTTYDYSNLPVDGTYIVTSRNQLGHTEIKAVDAKFGTATSLVGPNGLATKWVYDGFGQKIEELRADGTSSVWVYDWCDASCPGFGIYKMSTYSAGAPDATAYFDAMSRKLRSQTTGLNGQTILADTQYNKRGQLSSTSRNYFLGDAVYLTQYTYDVLDRVSRVTSPDGGVVETTYNGLTTTVRKYDPNGDYDQNTSQIQNAVGQEIQLIDEANQSLYKQYDAFGKLLLTTDPAGNIISLSYDKRGRKIVMDDPDMGHWEYSYDALGQLRWQKDANNQVVTMAYDVLGRMVRRDEQEGRITWTYDSASKGIGKLASVTSPNYQQALGYDSVGRLVRDSRVLDGTSLTTSTRYDAFGHVERLIYPSGFQVAYNYNTNGYQTRAYNAVSTADVFWEASNYDPDGNLVTFTLGGSIRTDRQYDPYSGRLTRITTGTNIQYLEYAYDSLGNLKRRVDQYQNLTEDFSYDARNRLIGSTISGYGNKTYAYDQLGNLTQKGGVSDYAYGQGGAGPHAVTLANGQSYTYDGNGNMLTGAGRSIYWTSYNKPDLISKAGTSVSFSYGPNRSRFKQVKGSGGVTTATLYFGKLYEQISKGGSTERKHYINAGGGTVAIYNQRSAGNDNLRYLHKDHLGSTDRITDELGNVVEGHSFDAFGSRRNINWSDPTGFLTSLETMRGFTGHEQLDEVGLVHMNGRVYDPVLGRFISADPQVQFASNLQSYNRYTYVHNNPLSYTDPSGFGIFSKIKKAVKKAFENPWVRLAVGIAIAAVASPFATGYVGLLTGSQTLAYAAGGFVGGFALGGITTGSLRGALIGGLQGAAFAVAGHAAFLKGARAFAGGLGAPVLHGAVGGTFGRASGGGFREGFLSAFSSKFVNANVYATTKNVVLGVVRSAVAGGAGALTAGGKFANGATTGAFSYLFNDALSDSYAKNPRTAAAAAELRRVQGLSNNQFAQEQFFGLLGEPGFTQGLTLGQVIDQFDSLVVNSAGLIRNFRFQQELSLRNIVADGLSTTITSSVASAASQAVNIIRSPSPSGVVRTFSRFLSGSAAGMIRNQNASPIVSCGLRSCTVE